MLQGVMLLVLIVTIIFYLMNNPDMHLTFLITGLLLAWFGYF